MKCTKCGAELMENEKVCAACGAPVEEKRKKAGGRIAAAAVVAAAVVGAGAFGVSRMGQKDPKEVVISAFENIYTEDQTDPLEELLGWKKLFENASAGSTQISLEMNFDSCSDEDTNRIFAGSGIKVGQKTDYDNKKTAAEIGVVYQNMDLAHLNLYCGDEMIMVSVPELSGKVFALDLSDGLAGRVAESPILGQMLKESGTDIEGLSDYIRELSERETEGGESNPYDLKALYNRYKEGSKAQENFKAAMTVEKADKAKYIMDGKEVNCQGYLVNISKDSMVEFLRTSSEFFLNDEELKKAYLEQLEVSTKMMRLFGGSVDTISAEEMQMQSYEQAEQTIRQVISQMDQSLSDVSMTVYVDKKGRLAAFSGSTAVNIAEGENRIQVTADVKLEGGTYLTENGQASVMIDGGTDKMVFDIEKTGTYDGKSWSSEGRIRVDGTEQNAGALNVTLKGDYSSETGEFSLAADGSVNEEADGKISVTANGVVDELEKGSVMHVTLDELAVSLSDDVSVALSGSYEQRPLGGEVTPPEGEQMDVVAADEAAWQSVMMEMYMNVIGLIGQLGPVLN